MLPRKVAGAAANGAEVGAIATANGANGASGPSGLMTEDRTVPSPVAVLPRRTDPHSQSNRPCAIAPARAEAAAAAAAAAIEAAVAGAIAFHEATPIRSTIL